ncbi:MAG: winged helix-turn-helix transcriptional regulator [Candidatus Diapherotrites archaeon]|uniref:Winged helix-turn-helix transcriptional regulator n=1 Tax=Candidatus Iainarchaeum sp. TaxID=3101447 RepID=A0A938YW96_9ARCH|nr:winged helix-turn-helix transcriptional regulator [Candidatus Diapherotrites archaeon]
MDVFRALGNDNRRRMLRILINRKMHVSALARELDIAVPVALKHARVLEGVGFVERARFGNTHVLQVRADALQRIKQLWDLFERPLTVEVSRGTSMLDALKRVSGLKIEKQRDGAYITSVDGKPGFYIYEVEGKLVEKPADKFKIERSAEVELKRLMPVVGKKIIINVKQEKP